MGKRNLYLKTTPVEEAKKIYLEALKKIWEPAYETIPVIEACKRVTRHATYAKTAHLFTMLRRWMESQLSLLGLMGHVRPILCA